MPKRWPTVTVTDDEWAGRFRNYQGSSAFAVKFVEALDTRYLVGALRDTPSRVEAIRCQIGADTNRKWLLSQIITALYDRDVISESEFDRTMTFIDDNGDLPGSVLFENL